MPDQNALIDEVLHFWFEQTLQNKRFAVDPGLDAEIARRFGALHAQWAADGALNALVEQARGVLAAIVVLDQFSRNLYRGDPRAFAQDAQALALAKQAIAAGQDQALPAEQRHFLYMPLMHSERVGDVEWCQALLEQLALPSAPEHFARRHAEVLRRFGRYPGRNAALGRISSPEEEAFLKAHPDGF